MQQQDSWTVGLSQLGGLGQAGGFGGRCCCAPVEKMDPLPGGHLDDEALRLGFPIGRRHGRQIQSEIGRSFGPGWYMLHRP